MAKWQCTACDEITEENSLLIAPNPFSPDENIWGCPICKNANGFEEICDEPGCKIPASCGFPTPGGYRRTCYKNSEFSTSPTPPPAEQEES